MKKVFSIMTIVALLAAMCLVHIPATAQGQATVTVESVSCKAGEQVSVAVQLSNNPGLTYLEMTPTYPAEWTMTPVNGDLISDMTKGKQLVWVADEDVTANGLLATLTFTVPESAQPGDYAIGFIVRNCNNYDEELVAVNVVSGTVTVEGEAAEPVFSEPFAQLKKGVTMQSDMGAIRFVAAVNGLNHQKVGLALSLSNNEPTADGINSFVFETRTVYTSVFADDQVVTAQTLGGEYVFALTLDNIPQAHFDTDIYVRAFVVTAEGETYYSIVKTYSVAQLLGVLEVGGQGSGSDLDFNEIP